MFDPVLIQVARAEAHIQLAKFRLDMLQRDRLVRDAVTAGLTKNEIHRLSGIARTTIDRILKDE